MSQIKFNFKNSRGDLLSGKIFSAGKKPASGLVYCHGLFSNKDGHKISLIGPYLAEKGIEVMAFDFFCSGESSGDFADISLIKEADDIKAALSHLKERGIEKITLAGSSMGAAAALLYSSGDETLNSSLILMAAPVDFKKLLSRLIPGINAEAPFGEGFTMIDGTAVNNRFLSELLCIDMKKAVKKINKAVLIFHGLLDKVVDLSNAEYLAENICPPPLLIKMSGGGHALSAGPEIKLIQEEMFRWMSCI